MHALAGQGIQVHRQGRDQGLTLAGAHLGDLALVQHHAADQLHVEMPHVQGAPAGLAYHREGIRQQRVEFFALSQTALEFVGLGAQVRVAQRRDARFQGIDAFHLLAHAADHTVIATTKNAFQNIHRSGALTSSLNAKRGSNDTPAAAVLLGRRAHQKRKRGFPGSSRKAATGRRMRGNRRKIGRGISGSLALAAGSKSATVARR